MFNLLRKSLGNVLKRFTKKVEEEPSEEVKEREEQIAEEAAQAQPKEKKEQPKKEEHKKETLKKEEQKKEAPKIEETKKEAPKKEESKREEPKATKSEEPRKETREEPRKEEHKKETLKIEEPKKELPRVEHRIEAEEPPKPKGFAARFADVFTKTKISAEKFDELFWELELSLLENNFASKVVEKIKEDLKAELVDKPLPRGKIEGTISRALGESLREILSFDVPDLIGLSKKKRPFIVLFVGVNGSGKTTTIAKIAHLFLDKGLKPVLVASDTFRAAAIQQLEEHANALGVKIIKHDYGADPAAVAFDGVEYAKAHEIDVVLIDTAGRLHTNKNLMDELKKVKRVAKPDVVLYVGESITGNDCIEQATIYNNEIGIDGVVLTKVDVDEKGGTPLSIAFVTEKPIWLIGMGQGYKDLMPFNADKILDGLGL